MRQFESLITGVSVVALSLVAGTAHGQILPASRGTVWNPGVPGGVPVRTQVCANINAASYGNGSTDATAAIQAALDACPEGRVVQLTGGIFRIDAAHGIIIAKGVTLRGVGPGLTLLRRTNGARMGSVTAIQRADPVIIIGPQRWPTSEGPSVALTTEGLKGAMSITVSSVAGLAAGQFVLIDDDNYNTSTWLPLPNRNGAPTSARIWGNDRTVFMLHSPSDSGDDPFPDSLGWFSRDGRPINEVKEIASVSGNTVTFTTPLHIDYRLAGGAQLTRYTGDDAHIKNASVEDLSVAGGANGNIRFECAAYSWVRNIESTMWLGEGVAINNSFRVEVRDSYIHETVWPNPGGGGYAISFANGSSEVLVENNIVMQANKVMVSRSAGAGSVIGYNYMDDGHIDYAPDWVEVGINGSHMVGAHHMLFEGNYSFNYDSDNTHGNAIYHTVFRNHLAGFRKTYPGMSNARTAGLMFGSWWHSFIGNVMGTPGRMAGWTYTDGDRNIWSLGYDPQHWEQDADPKVLSTILREGNFDYVTNQVRWDTAPQTIPNSLYLTAKPAFFGTNTWPWVDPTGTTKLYTLPAKARFESKPAVGSRFYSVTPCRVADTRNPVGPTGGPAVDGGGATRDFQVVGWCGIPADARAIAANVTVVNPPSNGHVTVFLPGVPTATSTLNVRTGRTRANSVVISLGMGRTAAQPGISVTSGLTGQFHFILDVVGYFK